MIYLNHTKVIFLTILFGIGAVNVVYGYPRKSDPCGEAIAAKADAMPDELVPGDLVDDYARGLAAWVKKQKRLPSVGELGEALGHENGELTAFFADTATPEDIPALVVLSRGLDEATYEGLRTELAKKVAIFFKENLRLPNTEEWCELTALASEVEITLVYGSLEGILSSAEEVSPHHFRTARNKLLRAYTKMSRYHGRTATLADLSEELGIEMAELEKLFGEGALFENLAALKEAAIAKTPISFRTVVDMDIFDEARTEALLNAIRTKKRLIVTTAVAGAPINRPFFESLLYYAKRNDAEILVFPANMMTTGLDPILLNTPGVHIIMNTLELSPWLALNRIRIMAKQINPLMGLQRMATRGQSQIVGSPKVHLRSLATVDNSVAPHKMLSTGAVTDPNYNGRLYISGRTDEIATHDHVMGAVILEKTHGTSDVIAIDGVGTFHLRHVEFIPERAGFTDLDYFYTADTKTKSRPAALVLGDIHVGDADQKLFASLRDQILKMKPEFIVLHDVMNGHSISHHDRFKLISVAQKAENGMLDLKEEIGRVVAFINAVLAIDSSIKVVIVPSNHDYWLHRWLQDGQFMREPHNTQLGLELARVFMDGEDPLKHALLEGGVEYPKRTIFVERGGSYKVGPRGRLVEVGQHGHAGANGSRGSILSLGVSADRIVFGHTHTYARHNGSVNVGTFTNLRLSYNREGVSNWNQSLALVGPNGEVQVLEHLDGEWFTAPGADIASPESFFMPEYPVVVPNNGVEGGGVGQVDQWSGR